MMLLRNIWMVLLCVLVVTLSAACNQKEVVAEEKTEGVLIVTADPGSAEILIQGKKYDSGSEIKLPAGEYFVIAECNGYTPMAKKVVVKAGTKESVDVSLQKNRTSALFVTKDDGVKITLKQGDHVIQSGSSPLVVTDLEPGEYTYTAEKQGYTTLTSPFNVDNRGMTEKVQIQLDNTIGFLKLNLQPVDAVVYVDGKEISYKNGDVLKLPAGIHEVRVAKNGYEEQNHRVEIRKKGKEELNFNLRQKQAKLSVVVEGHPDATVKINGEVVNSPEKWQNVDAGVYKIEVTKAFYDKIETEIVLKPEQEEQVRITDLTRNTGSIRLKLDHPGIVIALNDKVIGATQPDPIGGTKEFVIDGLAVGGKYKLTFEHPYQLSDPRPRSVTIKKDNKRVALKVPFVIANATLRYKNGSNRISGNVFVKNYNDEMVDVTFKKGSGIVGERIRKDEVIIEYLPPIVVDPKFKSSTYDLLSEPGK